MNSQSSLIAEAIRLSEDRARTKNWKRWGPYLSERQWATVREDYSPYGNCWDFFSHTMLEAGLIAGEKTDYWDSPTENAGSVSVSHCGMEKIRF
jgi:hypothetical protein